MTFSITLDGVINIIIMKNLFLITTLVTCIMACSKNDDSSNEKQNLTEIGEYSLILNGAGFSEHRVELFNDTINFVGAGTLFAASDKLANAIGVVVPTSGEGSTTIVEYDESMTNPSGYQTDAASFFIDTDTYRSENGVFEVEEFIFDGNNCAVWKGNLNINFTVDGNGSDVLNVKGTFEVSSSGCD